MINLKKILLCFLSCILVLMPFEGVLVSAQDTTSPSDNNTALDAGDVSLTPAQQTYYSSLYGETATGGDWTGPALKMSGIDTGALMNGKVDARVVDLLNYLTTSQKDGGAGHWYIGVQRIIKNYRGKKDLSKETDYSALSDQAGYTIEPNESAHAEDRAQAVDISAIDTYQCTIKGKPGQADKKTPPRPIQVKWQDQAPGKTLGDSGSGGAKNDTYFGVGSSFFASALLTGLSDNTDIDPSQFTLSDNSLPGVALSMGQSVLQDELGVKFPASGDLTDSLTQLGKNIIAQQTGLPASTFSGSTLDEWKDNIVKGSITKDLKLPDGSLAGSTVDDWITSTGKRVAEDVLQLRPGILDKIPATTGINGLAAAKIETLGDLPSDALLALNNGIITTTNQSLANLLGNASQLDERLGVAAGSTSALAQGKISAKAMTDLVAAKIKSDYIDRFNTWSTQDSSMQKFGQVATKDFPDWKGADKAWGVPHGALDALLNKKADTFYRLAGAQRWSDTMGLPTQQQSQLIKQAATGKISSVDVAAARTNPSALTSPDWVKLFKGSDQDRQTIFNTVADSFFQNNILNKLQTDLYLNFKPSNLATVYNGTGDITAFAKQLGAGLLESNFDLPDGTISNALNQNSSSLATVLDPKIIQSISDQMNLDTGLSTVFKQAGAYQIGTADVTALLQGQTTPVLAKLGGKAFDESVQALPGNTFDYLSGNISSSQLFSDASLYTIAKKIGLSSDDPKIKTDDFKAGKDSRVDYLNSVISGNKDKINKSILEYAFNIDSGMDGIYKFNLDDTVNKLKNISHDPAAALDNLSGLLSESIAASSGLNAGSLTQVLKDPLNAATTFVDQGTALLSRAIGLDQPDLLSLAGGATSTLKQLYTSPESYISFGTTPFTTGINGPPNLGDINNKMTDVFKNYDSLISNTTGITNLSHADNFLTGAFNDALSSWGIAINITGINDGLKVPAATVDYTTLSKAVFGDDKILTDTINKSIHDFDSNSKIQSHNTLDSFINGSVRNTMNDFKNVANFKIIDAGLIKKDSNVPVGFAQAMLTGSTDDKVKMLGDYAQNAGFDDQLLSDKFGFDVPDGFSGKLIDFASGKGSITDLASDLIDVDTLKDTAFTFADAEFGFTDGTTSQLADVFQGKADVAQAFANADIGIGEAQGDENMLAIQAADMFTGGAVTGLTSSIDGSLGMPSGTTMGIVIFLVTGDPSQLIDVVFGKIFGWGEIKCPDLGQLARDKVQQVLTQVTQFGIDQQKSDNPAPVIPSQIMTWRQEDITALLPLSQQLYGTGGRLDKAGIFQSLNPQVIHIGF